MMVDVNEQETGRYPPQANSQATNRPDIKMVIGIFAHIPIDRRTGCYSVGGYERIRDSER